MKTYNKKGFSLIELLVALSILAVVAAVIVPRFLNVRTQAAQTATQSQQRTLQRAFAQFISLGGTAPATPSAVDMLNFLSNTSSINQTTGVVTRAGTAPSGWSDSGGSFGSGTISMSLGTINTLAAAPTTAPANAGYYIQGANAYYADGAGGLYTITCTLPGAVIFTPTAGLTPANTATATIQ